MVHWSSETSTNQSDVIIRSDDRFLYKMYLVVDSDSYCLKYICLTLFFVYFLVLILTNILEFYSSCFFPHTDKHLAVLSQHTFDTQSIHIFGLVYYLSAARNSPFYIRCYTYGNQCFVLFNVYKWKNCSL